MWSNFGPRIAVHWPNYSAAYWRPIYDWFAGSKYLIGSKLGSHVTTQSTTFLKWINLYQLDCNPACSTFSAKLIEQTAILPSQFWTKIVGSSCRDITCQNQIWQNWAQPNDSSGACCFSHESGVSPLLHHAFWCWYCNNQRWDNDNWFELMIWTQNVQCYWNFTLADEISQFSWTIPFEELADTRMKAMPCPKLKMLPIQQWSLSSTFPKLLTQPPSPDPPHLTHFLTDNWCQPASRLCRAVASRHQEGSWHVPTKPSSNQSICCAIHNNNTNPSWPRKGVSGVQNWPLNKTAFLALSLEIWLVQMRNTTCHQVERLTTIQLLPREGILDVQNWLLYIPFKDSAKLNTFRVEAGKAKKCGSMQNINYAPASSINQHMLTNIWRIQLWFISICLVKLLI